MEMRGYKHYKEEAVLTMTQGELLNLLYDELVKRLMQAELMYEKQEYPAAEICIDKAERIIKHLNETLDHKYQISADLSRLYEYFCYELARVKTGRNMEELARVKGMVCELRDSFKQADKTALASPPTVPIEQSVGGET